MPRSRLLPLSLALRFDENNVAKLETRDGDGNTVSTLRSSETTLTR